MDAAPATEESGRVMAARNVRAELRELAANEMVPMAPSPERSACRLRCLMIWLAERRRIDGAIVGRIIEFIDDRAVIWHAMDEATNSIRQEFATRLIANLSILGSEMEHCGGGARGPA